MTAENHNCLQCGSPMTVAPEDYLYDRHGIAVTLVGVPVYRCASCGDYEVAIPRIEELQHVLASRIIRKTDPSDPVTPAELRFVRKALGWASESKDEDLVLKYQRDDRPDHEGYAVGHIAVGPCPPNSCDGSCRIYRELAYPLDKREREVDAISAACSCGWRSSRFRPCKLTRWTKTMFPGLLHVDADPRDEMIIHALWTRHSLESGDDMQAYQLKLAGEIIVRYAEAFRRMAE